jgi:hypothetical protein
MRLWIHRVSGAIGQEWLAHRQPVASRTWAPKTHLAVPYDSRILTVFRYSKPINAPSASWRHEQLSAFQQQGMPGP